MIKQLAAICVLTAACSGEHVVERDPLLDVPVDMQSGTSSIVFHRPLPLGTRLHVQGVYRKHHRVTALASGYVVNQELTNLQMAYDLNKTFVAVDLDGYPKRVRYDVALVESTDADLPPIAATGEGRAGRIHDPNEDRIFASRGQQFDIQRIAGEYQISMHSGVLSQVEHEALTDPFGPGYEFWFETQLALMFAPKAPKREGDEWDIDTERAGALLGIMGDLVDIKKVTGRATFVSLERVGNIPVQRIHASIRAEGKVAQQLTSKIYANNNRVDLDYTGLFPVDLSLPPFEHDWTVKATGQLVAQFRDDLCDIEFEALSEHRSRVLEVRR